MDYFPPVKVIFHITGEPTKLRDEKAKTTMNLKGFYIDQYEVINAQYREFLQATKRNPPDQWIDGEYPPGEGQYPVTNINWISARLYCEWAGKRLPTEEEWEKAARDSDGRLFPWGNRFETGKANVWEEGVRKPQEVGKYPEDRSPYGVYDMVGNVMEWTETIFKNDLAIARGGVGPTMAQSRARIRRRSPSWMRSATPWGFAASAQRLRRNIWRVIE